MQPNHVAEGVLQRIIAAYLRPGQQRHAWMLPPDLARRRGRKYDECARPIAEGQIAAHLAGRATYAVPAAAHGLASVLPLDVDAGGLDAIRALLREADHRGWFTFGQYAPYDHPSDGWQERGYVWLVVAELTAAERLQQAGHTLIDAVDRAGWRIDSRAHAGDTRLPFGRHTFAVQIGWLIVRNAVLSLDTDRDHALATLAAAYRENSVDSLPLLSPATPATAVATYQLPNAGGLSIDAIKAQFNADVPLTATLEKYGGRRDRHSPQLWHCPCGNHRGVSASLHLQEARQPAYGDYIANGHNPACHFATGHRKVWDSFNVELALSGRSFVEMLRYAREVIGTQRSQRAHNGSGAAIQGDQGMETISTSSDGAERFTARHYASKHDPP